MTGSDPITVKNGCRFNVGFNVGSSCGTARFLQRDIFDLTPRSIPGRQREEHLAIFLALRHPRTDSDFPEFASNSDQNGEDFGLIE